VRPTLLIRIISILLGCQDPGGLLTLLIVLTGSWQDFDFPDGPDGPDGPGGPDVLIVLIVLIVLTGS